MNVRTPRVLKWMYPSIICRIPTKEKKIYLTFDDGPIPDITPQVVQLLKQYNAKATFFCVGNNVQKHPEEYSLLHREKQAVGNHTQHHLNGFKTSLNDYLEDVREASVAISSKLFRPPYGRMRPSQYKALKNNYTIVMWDVLSYDFDSSVPRELCLQNVIRHTRNGSIIVFHDSIKAADKMLFVLPRILKHFSEAGYIFETISQTN